MRMLILLCATTLCLAQDGKEPTVSEHLEVSLKKVVVRVLDSDGDPVQGLEAKDFVLKNRRKGTGIVSFEAFSTPEPVATSAAVAEKEAPSETVETATPEAEGLTTPPKKYLSLLFDSSMMTRDGFENTKKALIDYLHEKVDDQTMINLAHLDLHYKVGTGFTANKDELITAIEKIEHTGRLRFWLHLLQRRINTGYEDQMMNKLGGASDIPALTARKGLMKNTHFRTYMHGVRAMSQALDAVDGERQIMVISGGSYPSVHSKEAFDLMLENLTEKGIAINSLVIREKELGGGPTTVLAYEKKTNYSALERGGLRYNNSESEHGTQSLAGPEDSSERTGGAVHQTGDIRKLDEAFATLNYLSENYYVLWYESTHESQKVSVSLKKPGKDWRIIYGKRSKKEKPYSKLGKKERELRFFATLQYGADSNQNDFPAHWDYQVYESGESVSYAVGANLKTSLMKSGEYELAIALLSEEREILAMTHRTVTLPERDFAFYEHLSAKEAPTYLSCTARHLASGKLTQKVFELEPRQEKGPSLSRIALIAERNALPAQFLGEGSSPYQANGQVLPPTFGANFGKGASLGAFVRLENTDAKSGWKVAAVLEGGELKRPARLLISDLGEEDSGFYFRLDSNSLAPGDYRLALTFMGPDDTVLTQERDFAIASGSVF